jgi:hypothetical protein
MNCLLLIRQTAFSIIQSICGSGIRCGRAFACKPPSAPPSLEIYCCIMTDFAVIPLSSMARRGASSVSAKQQPLCRDQS